MPQPYEEYHTGLPYYNRKLGRYLISFYRGSRRVKTTIYARYLMEVHLGKYLDNDENVHHKNNKSTDDRIDNLEILTRAEHTRLHNPTLKQSFQCDHCRQYFELIGHNLAIRKYNLENKNQKSIFCSQECKAKSQKYTENYECSYCGNK